MITPYGGGAGMVMAPQPLWILLRALKKIIRESNFSRA